MNSRNLKLSVGLILVLGILYFAIEGKPRKMQNIPAGMWGGEHIRIEIDGPAARVEYDCAHGFITGPLKLDSKGKFSLAGTHVREGGPTRIDGDRDGTPARFTGWTDGKKMTLTVRLEGANEDLGTFELEHGKSVRLHKCR